MKVNIHIRNGCTRYIMPLCGGKKEFSVKYSYRFAFVYCKDNLVRKIEFNKDIKSTDILDGSQFGELIFNFGG